MNALYIWTFILVGLFSGLIIVFTFINRDKREKNLRDIPAFYRLQGAIELAVEDGSRIHVAIGHSDITSPRGAAALIGLSMLKRIAIVAAESDVPPVATAGNGTLAILAQDTIRSTFQSMDIMTSYNNSLGRVSGLTPFSYTAGVMSVISDEGVSTNLMAGSFGGEVGLIANAAYRKHIVTLAGTDNLPGQAVLYATAHEPLIGEELYAGGAYIGAGSMHVASLQTQDIVRWIMAVVIVLSALFGIFQ